MKPYLLYHIWRRQMADYGGSTPWLLTSHTLKARTDKEAESKLRRMFAGAGFSCMSLVAVYGRDPNQ